MRGDSVSPGVSAATGRGFMLNDYTERKKDAQRSHHLQSAALAGASGPLEEWIRLLQCRGARVWGFISTLTASSFKTPADILHPAVCFSGVGRRGLADMKHPFRFVDPAT